MFWNVILSNVCYHLSNIICFVLLIVTCRHTKRTYPKFGRNIQRSNDQAIRFIKLLNAALFPHEILALLALVTFGRKLILGYYLLSYFVLPITNFIKIYDENNSIYPYITIILCFSSIAGIVRKVKENGIDEYRLVTSSDNLIHII